MQKEQVDISAILNICDEIRLKSPKMTALGIRYLLSIAQTPDLPVEEYHKAASGVDLYSHGNTVLKKLMDLGYINLSDKISPSNGTASVTPKLTNALGWGTKLDLTVTVIRQNDQITVTSPYHPLIPITAQKLSAKWNPPRWIYSLGVEPQVVDLYQRVFGEFDTPAQRVDIVCTPPIQQLADFFIPETHSYFFLGRRVMSMNKSGRVTLGAGVRLLKGTIKVNSTSDNKHGVLAISDDAEIYIAEAPLPLVEKLEQHCGSLIRRAAH